MTDNTPRDRLIAAVHTALNDFETEMSELERLWLIHDYNRTADPPMFAIIVSLLRPRRQALQDKLNSYWLAEASTGRAWLVYFEERQISQPDSALGNTNFMLREMYDGLVVRCQKLGFLGFLLAAGIVGSAV